MGPSGYCHRKSAGRMPSAAAFLVTSLRPYSMASRLTFIRSTSAGWMLTTSRCIPSHPQNRTGWDSLAPDQGASLPFETLSLLHKSHWRLVTGPGSFSGSGSLSFSCSLFPLACSLFSDQALDRLVSSSSIRYRTFTDDLSTLSSSRGLTCF